MNVELRDEARDDLIHAAEFYQSQSLGLDHYFLQCLQEDIKKLEATAGIHATYRGFHRALSERFPYAIYYKILDGEAVVFRVLDCRRDPRKIAGDLKSVS